MAITKNSIVIKILISMMVVLLLQATVIVVAIFASRVLENLNETALNLFQEKASSRTMYIERELVERWRNVTGSDDHFIKTAENKCHEDGISLKDLNNHPDGNILPTTQNIIDSSQDELIAMLRRTTATGAFIMFTGGDEYTKFGLYIRNADPRSNLANNADLQIEISPMGFNNKYGIPMSSYHDTVFDSGNLKKTSGGEGFKDFYAKPIETFNRHPEYGVQDCGYWSEKYFLNSSTIPVITYTVPLISEGKVFGLIGIELAENYVKSFMPFTDLDSQGSGGYILGYLTLKENGESDFTQITGTGGIITLINSGDIEGMQKSLKKHGGGVVSFVDKSAKTTFYGASQTIKIYSTNTPMDNTYIALVGILDKKIIFANATGVTVSMTTALVSSLVLSLVVILLSAIFFAKPIMKLTAKINSQTPGTKLLINKVNISEIDDLTLALEHYNNKFIESMAKMSQIIDIAKVPIAAFEFSKKDHSVFFTDKFFSIMGIKQPENVNTDRLISLLKRTDENALSKSINADGIITYNFTDDYENQRWVELTLIESDEKTTGVVRDVTKESVEKIKLEYERDYDLLTEIYNRRAFSAKAHLLFNGDKLENAALVLIDIDNLKYINDTYGHDYGDEYIRLTANVLKDFSGEHGIVARMAGDEFYVLFYNFPNAEAISEEIACLEKALSKASMRLPDGKRAKVRVSAGVSWYPTDSMAFEELVRFADFAMYEIKTSKKGEFHDFDSNTYHKQSFLLESKEDLNELIEKQMVEYYFQPIIRADNGEVFAYEALMRSKHPAFHRPREILELARVQYKLGLIEKLTWFKAMDAYSSMLKEFKGKKIFINSVSNQILSAADFELLQQKYPEILNLVVMELTESEKANDLFSQKKCNRMKRWGAEVALDDFGTGYSNESALLDLDPHYVKIDMSLIRGIDLDVNRRALVMNTLSYTRERGIKAIAEGIETENELKELVEMGVDYIQGFYLAKPLLHPDEPTKEIKEKIQKYYADSKKHKGANNQDEK